MATAASSARPSSSRRRACSSRACAALARSPCRSRAWRVDSSVSSGQSGRASPAPRRLRPARSAPAPAPAPGGTRGPRAAAGARARSRSPSWARAMPRSASAGGSPRSATWCSASSGSPAASARAAAARGASMGCPGAAASALGQGHGARSSTRRRFPTPVRDRCRWRPGAWPRRRIPRPACRRIRLFDCCTRAIHGLRRRLRQLGVFGQFRRHGRVIPAPQEGSVVAVGGADDLDRGRGMHAVGQHEADQPFVHVHRPALGLVQVPGTAMGGGGGLHAFQALRDIDAGSAGAVLWASVMSGWFQEGVRVMTWVRPRPDAATDRPRCRARSAFLCRPGRSRVFEHAPREGCPARRRRTGPRHPACARHSRTAGGRLRWRSPAPGAPLQPVGELDAVGAGQWRQAGPADRVAVGHHGPVAELAGRLAQPVQQFAAARLGGRLDAGAVAHDLGVGLQGQQHGHVVHAHAAQGNRRTFGWDSDDGHEPGWRGRSGYLLRRG